MLKVELNGKTIQTADDKQVIHINDVPVEIERVGNSIYVNQMAINLVIVDKKGLGLIKAGKWVVGVGAVAGLGFLAVTNQEWLIANVPGGAEYLIDYITTMSSDIFGFVSGLISSPEPAAVPADVTGQ